MKQALEVQLDPMTVRLLEFIGNNGGPSKVAKRIGIKPSVFYNYEAGRNKQPSPEILQRLTIEYPTKFDPMYILTGQSIVSMVTTPPASSSSSNDSRILEIQNEALKNEVALLKDTVNILRTIVGTQLGKDLEVKNESANNTTLDGQYLLPMDSPARKLHPRIININMRDALAMGRTWK